MKKAIEYEAQGDLGKARECRERAAGMTREIEKKRKSEPYQFQVEADHALLENANQELEWARENLKPEELKTNLPYWQGLIEARNRECHEENSYVIDTRTDKLKIQNVEHGGKTASILSQLGPVGEKTISYELAGIPPLTEEEEGTEETPSPQEWEASLQKVG